MEDFEFDVGFFDYAERNEHEGDIHPQDVVEEEILREIEMEEEG